MALLSAALLGKHTLSFLVRVLFYLTTGLTCVITLWAGLIALSAVVKNRVLEPSGR